MPAVELCSNSAPLVAVLGQLHAGCWPVGCWLAGWLVGGWLVAGWWLAGPVDLASAAAWILNRDRAGERTGMYLVSAKVNLKKKFRNRLGYI